MSAIVSLSKVSKSYVRGKQEVSVLRDLDLSIEAGDFAALMGPSGSGKTTLLNLIGGLDQPTSRQHHRGGAATRNAERRRRSRSGARENIGFVFQFYNLLPVLTAQRNVELPLLLTSLNRAQRKKNAATALQIVGLADRASHKPGELSGGQQQRVAIARALVADPTLLDLRRAHRRPRPRHRRRNSGSARAAES